MTCPVCGGAGVVDTSPPGVDRAPWLQTDTDCPRCGGTGEVHTGPTYASLSLQGQAALSWVVNVGGVAPSSLTPALNSLGRSGYATYNTRYGWTATDAGRALLPDYRHAHPEETAR